MPKKLDTIKKSLRGYFRRIDKPLFILTIFALFFGMLIQYSELKSEFITRRAFYAQLFAGAIGVAAMALMVELDYHRLAARWKLHLPVTVGLTLLTFTNLSIVYRPDGSDDSAWLRFGSFSLQPGEFLKFSFILTFAWHLSCVKDNLNHPKNVLLLCAHGAAFCILIFLQGDMGSALVFFMIFLTMIFQANLNRKYIFLGIGCMAAIVPVVWQILPDYIQNRFLVLQDLDNASLKEAYQQLMARRILGSGMSFGKGLFSDDFIYVYAIENDLVFSHVGQALGFVGCTAVLLLLTAICGKILLNIRGSKDFLGGCIAAGVFGMFFFQSSLNIGMVLGVLPVIGVTLPFFSQGGSSLVVSCLAVGLVLSVGAESKTRLVVRGSR